MNTSVSGTPLALLRLEGAAALIGAVVGYRQLGGSWGTFAVLLLVPDLGLIGYWANSRVGAATYNVSHTYLGPLLLAGLGYSGLVHNVWPVCLIWVAHIGMDRALGLGLKFGSAFRDTHLGTVGRPARVT
jgi:Domain of unknown function (DUF4260)